MHPPPTINQPSEWINVEVADRRIIPSGNLIFQALSISRRDSTRSINGRMPSSLEMAIDSSSGTCLAPRC